MTATQENPNAVLSQSVKTACQAASFAGNGFCFDSDLQSGLKRNVDSFIETGDEDYLELVVLYLTKMREEKEKQQIAAEEREIDLQREEKARIEAEEDRHYLFLRDRHSREALH